MTNGQKSVKNAEEVEDHDQIIKKNQPQVRRRKVENVKRVKKGKLITEGQGLMLRTIKGKLFPQSVKIYQF